MLRALLAALRGLVSLGVLGGIALAFYAVGHDGRLPWQPEATHGKDWCDTHQVPLSTDDKCNPKLARGGLLVAREHEPKDGECPNTVVRITMPPDVAERVGIQLIEVQPRSVSESLKTTAETAYAPTRYARVAPRIAGIVREVRASMGQDVVAGAVLAIVEAPEMGQAATTYRQAVAQLRLREKTHAQEKELTEKKISSGHDLLVATAELEEARLSASAARQHLLTLGLGADRIETLEGTEDPVSTIEVRAPFDGTILDASAVLGENAGPDKPLFSVADASRMWLSIDVYEADVTKVEKDQRVTFTMDGMPGLRFTGRITALGGSVDERTRTLRVVAEVKNPQGILREHMFGHVDIQVKPPEPKLIVPRDAVQTDGDCYFVFTSASANVFRTRPVDLGIAYQSGYEIKGGLVAGERVVTVGSFSLKSEVLRGEMGAG